MCNQHSNKSQEVYIVQSHFFIGIQYLISSCNINTYSNRNICKNKETDHQIQSAPAFKHFLPTGTGIDTSKENFYVDNSPLVLNSIFFILLVQMPKRFRRQRYDVVENHATVAA